MGTKRERRPEGWLPIADMPRVFGVSGHSFDRYVRPLILKDAMRTEDRKILVYCRDAIESWALHKFQAPAADGDPMLVSGDSPALERYRLAKAQHAELDLAERSHELVSVAQLTAAWDLVSSSWRRACNVLENQCGPEAKRILDEVLNAAEQSIENMKGPSDART